jgi:ketosteroid isomerase-like protein
MGRPDMEQKIRTAFERWNRADYSFDERSMHPDIEIRSLTGVLTGGVYRGREGLAEWARDVTESFDEWSLAVDEVEETGPTRVLAVGSVHFRGRESGVAIDAPCAWLVDHEDGLVTRFEVFANRVSEARAIAAGG